MSRLSTAEYSQHSGLSAYRLRLLYKQGILPALHIGNGTGRQRLLWDAQECDRVLSDITETQRAERAAAVANEA